MSQKDKFITINNSFSNENNKIQDNINIFKPIFQKWPNNSFIDLYKSNNINKKEKKMNFIVEHNKNSTFLNINNATFPFNKNINEINIENKEKIQNIENEKQIIKFINNNHKNKTKDFPKNEKKLNKKKIKKIHTSFDDDNILRKIQVQFLSFIVNFSNDVIYFFSNDLSFPRFHHLDYEIKKVVNKITVKKLKNKTIGDILKSDITPKMKKSSKDINTIVYNEIISKYPFLEKFFEINYINLFKQYYNNENNIFEFNGQIIPLSNETKRKTYNYLIQKKNKIFQEKIKYVSINYYLNTYKRIKRPNFIINA